MPDSTPIIGRVLSHYRILDEVGRGGMATVYRALDTSLGREVAVKVLHRHLAGEAESRSRLEREAQAVAKLRHDNILEIHDYSAADSTESESFIVTEFIRGPTLTAFLGEHTVHVPDVAAMIVHELAAALDTAHKAGIIHRDIKPENVMIRSDDGRVKLTDFGIAQIIDKERLTATGQLIGSPAYLAPELVEGGRIDFRTDVFSLGIVLYRVATGQLPFQGRNPHEMMKRIVEGRYAPPDQVNSAVGRGLARIMARAMARRPDDRYPDMESLRRDLAAELRDAGIDDVRAELSRYFADPAAWEKEARPLLTAALVKSARRELSRAKGAAALALVGRALALSPGDGAAQALFDRIGRSRLRGRVAIVVVAAALLAGGGAWAVRYRALHVTRLPIAAAPTTPSAPGDRAPGNAAARPPDAVAARPAGSNGEPRVRPPPATPVTPVRNHPALTPAFRQVAINIAVQKNVQMFVDEKLLGPWHPGVPITVSAGRHTLKFRNPSCYDVRYELGADEKSIDVQMKWKEATLTVVTTPDGAQVVTYPENGPSHLWRGGEPALVPIPAMSEDGFEAVKLEVREPGYKTETKPIKVRAGQKTQLTIELQKAR